MRELLRHATARGLASAYTRRVLSAFDKPAPSVAAGVAGVAGVARTAGNGAAGNAAAGGATNAPVPEQALTTRELEILRLISTGMRNQEIADHLDISGATVKRHIANAYGKLGASHRTEALLRARELKLL